MRRALFAACVLAGCASGRNADSPDAAVGGPLTPDAKVWRDGAIEGTPDAFVIPPDAATIVTPDAAAPDAYVCQPTNQQLLANPVLDLNPSGMGWVQTPIVSAYPIITGDDGIVEHSAPFKAWLGGWDGDSPGVTTVSDELYQEIVIPAGTTDLRLTGHYEVRTLEATATAYDTAQLALVKPDGTPIATVLSLSNGTPTTAWTAIDHVFANASALAGQTVRVRITTSNDFIDSTSFYFDTLALTATVCN